MTHKNDFDEVLLSNQSDELTKMFTENYVSLVLEDLFTNIKDTKKAEDTINSVDKLLYYLNALLSKLREQNKLNEVLGGEFDVNASSIYKTDKIEIPFYLELDLMIGLIEIYYVNKCDDIDEILLMVEKLKMIRNEVSNLDYNDIFLPSERENGFAFSDILASCGNFKIELKEIYGLKCLGVSIATRKIGEKYIYSDAQPFYEKDAITIGRWKQQNINRLIEIAGKYFVDYEDAKKHHEEGVDIVPPSFLIEEKIVDQDIDPNILMYLTKIGYLRDHYEDQYDLALAASSYLDEIEKIETLKTSKDFAIDMAYIRYRYMNPLWKILNHKRKPEYIDFETLTEDEISNLYVGRKR